MFSGKELLGQCTELGIRYDIAMYAKSANSAIYFYDLRVLVLTLITLIGWVIGNANKILYKICTLLPRLVLSFV